MCVEREIRSTKSMVIFVRLHDNVMAEWVPKTHFSITIAGSHFVLATPAKLVL